jgi:hypothetical protein
MTTGFAPERRQTARVDLGGRVECRLDFRTRVRLIDISLSGGLLAVEQPLPVGTPAHLQSGLGAGAFNAGVQVRRSVGLPAALPLKALGAVFTGMDERSRRTLEDFLRKASH